MCFCKIEDGEKWLVGFSISPMCIFAAFVPRCGRCNKLIVFFGIIGAVVGLLILLSRSEKLKTLLRNRIARWANDQVVQSHQTVEEEKRKKITWHFAVFCNARHALVYKMV